MPRLADTGVEGLELNFLCSAEDFDIPSKDERNR